MSMKMQAILGEGQQERTGVPPAVHSHKECPGCAQVAGGTDDGRGRSDPCSRKLGLIIRTRLMARSMARGPPSFLPAGG